MANLVATPHPTAPTPSASPPQLLISETLMKSMGQEGSGNGSSGPAGGEGSSEGGAEGGAEGGSAAAASKEASQDGGKPPLRKVDIEELDDSAGGGDD